MDWGSFSLGFLAGFGTIGLSILFMLTMATRRYLREEVKEVIDEQGDDPS